MQFHRCKTCGCVTHWWPVDESVNRMGANANLMPRDVLEKASVIPFDGAGM
ncbi:MAG: aldehyde-activating protein [Proteobacteria bacterium]|nr:aldehyde-activating protein [Pseudomonadota bacterium]